MDLVRVLLSVALFVAFVPGVLVTLPKHGSRTTVLAVHALLFAVVAHVVMQAYQKYVEGFGNYGAAGCPKGFVMNSDGVCKPDPACSGPSCTTPGINQTKK